MYNKRKAGMSAIALALTLTVAFPMQTMGAPVISLGGFSAGADTVLSKTPSLEVQANTNQTNAAELTLGAGVQPTDEEAVEDVSFTAGAGGLVTASISVVPEDMDEQSYDEEEEAGGLFGYTNLGIARVEDHLNVRAGAEKDSKIVGKMENDSGCEVLEVVDGMAHIISGSVEGYVSTDYLLTGTAAEVYASAIVKELATVTADGLKMRTAPSLEAEVYDMVAYGEELEVLEKLDGWVAVDFDGQKVYVSADYVSVDRKLKTALNMTEFLYGEGVSDVRVEICEYAKQFLGNPYVWGGTSLTKGADCSGFVLSVYAKFGVGLPHSSRAQANCGTRIKVSEMKPGDLVFYSNGSRINHVAMYIGGGQVIHASSPKTGIRISSTYYRSPVAAVRLLYD